EINCEHVRGFTLQAFANAIRPLQVVPEPLAQNDQPSGGGPDSSEERRGSLVKREQVLLAELIITLVRFDCNEVCIRKPGKKVNCRAPDVRTAVDNETGVGVVAEVGILFFGENLPDHGRIT